MRRRIGVQLFPGEWFWLSLFCESSGAADDIDI